MDGSCSDKPILVPMNEPHDNSLEPFSKDFSDQLDR
jgi:hypothetical protein